MRFFKHRKSSVQQAEPRSADPATEDDVILAYRLILRREPDEDGLRHYRQRAAAGSLLLDDLIRELLTSEERAVLITRPTASSGASVSDAKAPIPAPLDNLNVIDPKDVIAKYSIEELNDVADLYYRRISDPTPLMLKPFAFLQETPQMLENLGALLGGLYLGKTMRVLDFGAGTCWLSRILTQLNCEAICCDPSPAALAIGRRLYELQPAMGEGLIGPTFLVFDGHRLELADQSVDRIICFDAFHHISNQQEVLAEFSRVLRPGGVAGFSEPGRRHSQSPQSQYEMRNHRVLENDIHLIDIQHKALAVGFSELTVRVLCDMQISADEYELMFSPEDNANIRNAVWNETYNTMFNRTVFFLKKGPIRLDSRTHIGLAHRLTTSTPLVTVRGDGRARVSVTITNTGTAHWLNRNIAVYGIVRLASHLYDADGVLLEVDHSRHDLPQPVAPGETIQMTVEVPVPSLSECRLDFDLVAEGVRWFENEGSHPVSVLVGQS